MEKRRESYLEELKIIKQTLKAQEGMQLIEPWAFFTWAGVTALGTTISAILYLYQGVIEPDLILTVWIPAIIIGGVLETVGWIRVLKREERVLYTDNMQRMLLSFLGILITFSFLGIGLATRGVDISGIIVLMMSVCFMVLGIFSWKELFIEAYLLLAVGIALFILSDGGSVYYITAATAVTAAFIAGGLHSAGKERGEMRRGKMEQEKQGRE
jgi:hypothetical protein